MKEDAHQGVDEAGNEVWIISLKPTAERMDVSGAGGRAAELETRYFLNSITGVEVFLQSDGILKAKGGEKVYRLR